MSTKDSLGDRMKGYEGVPRNRLVRRMPVMIRLDGKAFHTFTRGMPRPYHRPFHEMMWHAAKYLCENIQGCQLAYVQSDEITLLLTDYAKLTTEAWFDYEVQKMTSVAAAMCTSAFFADMVNRTLRGEGRAQGQMVRALPQFTKLPAFDARAWNVPKEEVTNAFIWRQQDATRNAIQMVGQSLFSHKELQGVSCNQIQEMVFSRHGINFNDLPIPQRRGVCIVKADTSRFVLNVNGFAKAVAGKVGKGGEEDLEMSDLEEIKRSKWVTDEAIPIFSQERDYVDRFVFPVLET